MRAKQWLIGFTSVTLPIGISYIIIAEDSDNANLLVNTKEYKDYVKKANQAIAELQKIDLAISTKAKFKPAYKDFLNVGDDDVMFQRKWDKMTS